MRTTTLRMTVLSVALLGLLLLAPLAFAQNPTGTLIGKAKDSDGGELPGVTVSVTSPNLQGSRTTQTGANGDYKLGFLPPGEYQATYELEGFATATRKLKLSAAQTAISDVTLPLAEVVEEIVVTSNIETISETATGSSTYTKDEVESLPIARTILETVNLAPGVHDTGPSTAPSINGAMSFENLFMINGVPNVDNVRGTPLPLFIEDSVQETTTSTSGVSAEYGRFTGGVINVITKSGGNDFEGSFRINYTNDDWRSKTPLSGDRIDDLSNELEATVGGPFWRDRIWFFAAGRQREEATTDQTVLTNITYNESDNEDRLEGKLTVGLTPSHNLIGSYLDLTRERAGSTFGSVLDLASLSNRQDPQELKSVNYTGILTSSFFVEAQYSERDFQIAAGSGGPSPTQPGIDGLIPGTLMRHRPTNRRFHSGTFCGDCPEQRLRNAENQLIKGSYFLTTEGSGSHDLVFGYDSFSDITFSVNHQSGSDFQVWAEDILIDSNNNIFPVFEGSQTWVVWWPPVGLDIARPTDFTTNSIYANDSWQLNENWSFNIGVRYDENDGVDSSGSAVTDDSKVSPRVGMSYDVKGDGDLVFNASYGTYVAAIASGGNIADGASTGGALAGFGSFYGGPSVNTDSSCLASGTCLSTEDSLRVLYDWYVGAGGAIDFLNDDLSTIPNLIFGCIPGATNIVVDPFRSPAADEFTFGVTKRLGSKGLFRADVVMRTWEDFYSELTSLETGSVLTDAGELDVTWIGNYGDNVLERDYIGLNAQFRYRFTDRFSLSGNYTLSELEGNINGESAGSGPVPTSPNSYSEYKDPAWNTPVGNLAADQRHKVRVWGIYDILDTERHSLNVSLLQNYFSGTPYSADGDVESPNFVNNPGYASPPTDVTYFYSPRGAFTTDNITRTDVALNYAFRWNLFGKSMEVFIQPEIINLFNEDGVEDPRDDVLDAVNSSAFAPFNPFTETPVEGVHWAKGDEFGQADDEDDFQEARTFRVSVGFRF